MNKPQSGAIGALRAGPIRQIAYLSRNIRATMRFYTDRLGVGPWFYEEVTVVADSVYRGAPAPLHLSAALAQWGPLQLEVVQPCGHSRSMFVDWCERPFAREIQQHIAMWPEHYDTALVQAYKAGFLPEQSGTTPWGRFVYLAHPDTPDQIIELSHATTERKAFYAAIASISEQWDGADPVRPFSAAHL